MKELIRVGIVGLDNWYHAFPYAEALARSQKGVLSAVYDRDQWKLDFIRKRYSVKEVYDSAEGVLDNPSIDAVIVTAATATHAQIALSAIESGKHVLCDKPLEVSVDRALEIEKAVERKGVTFAMSFPRRARQLYREARKAIIAGAIGSVLCVVETGKYALPSESPISQRPGWYAQKNEAGGGGFVDHAVHQVDMLRWLISSEVVSVMCRLDNLLYRQLEVDDYGVAILKFENGVVATIESSWLSSGRSIDVIDMQGTTGSLRIDVSTNSLEISNDRSGQKTAQIYPPKFFMPIEGTMKMPIDGFDELLEDFLVAVTTGGRPLATIEDGRVGVEVLSAAAQSAQHGTAVEL